MVLLFLLVAGFFHIAGAQEFDAGNGSLGACTAATFTSGGTYQCASVSINAPVTITTGGNVLIKSTGEVLINDVITIAGQNGDHGGNLFAPGNISSGGAPGPGGLDGGSCDGNNTCVSPDNDGSGGASGGAMYTGFGGGQGGGGGGGGSHGVIGSAGTKGATADGGNGGNSGATFGDENNFETSFSGGAGGGGGGVGQDGGLNDTLGAGGGGGGGAIRIEAQGSIRITATGAINANGGNGGAGTLTAPNGPGGGGGGGAGGAIFLQSLMSITLDNAGLLNVSGGTGGAGQGGGDGDGGAGGRGRIRLDDTDGIIANAPAFSVKKILSGNASGATLDSISSDISCASLTMIDYNENNHPQNPLNMIVSFLCGLFLIRFFRLSKDS
ncbi:MAG: hypothetical protein HYV97_16380 [Bdellovibrio sp.]|nr:hypothetical protein [Bdellovibrio sp.]